MGEIIFSKYSNERSRCFAIRTDILEEKDEKWVEKTALYPEGQEHVKNIPLWSHKLNELCSEISFCANKCEQIENGIRLEYIEARSLGEYLDSLLGKGRIEEAQHELMKYLQQVKRIYSHKPFTMTEDFEKVFGKVELPENLTCAEITDIDMICDNIMLTDPITIVDYEWTFAFPVPCEFVLYRIIHYYVQTHKTLRTAVGEEMLYEKFGITEEQRKGFVRMEEGFQKYITGKHIPMREMFADMTPGTMVFCNPNGSTLQVFFGNWAEGYQEQNSVRRAIEGNMVNCEIDLPKCCEILRIDPGDEPCAVHIKEMKFDGQPASLENVTVPQGVISGDWVFISKYDPFIADIPVPKGARKLGLKWEIHPENQDMLTGICDMGMKNSNRFHIPNIYKKVAKKKGK